MTQSLYETQVNLTRGLPGGAFDSNFPANQIFRTLSGGKTRQTVAAISVGGTIGTETFAVTVPVTLPNGSAASVVATVIADTIANTAAEVEAALAVALQSNTDFDQVARATAISGNLVITAKDFGVNPIGVVSCTASGSATITASPTVTAAANAAVIPFGYGVGIDATDSDTECRLFATGLTILGIAGHEYTGVQNFPPNNLPLSSSTPDAWQPGDVIRIWDFRAKGQRIWVPIADTPTRFAVPYLNNTTGAVQAASSGGTALTGAVFFTAKTDGLVVIQF